MKTNDLILQTVTKVVLFIILVFAVFILNVGHHSPGGGFVGGLLTASAFVLLTLAFGMETIKKVIPVNFRHVMALGLLIAFLCGIGSTVFQYPFLTHTFGYVHLPLLGETELTTALIFDIGVYLTVTGAAMTAILTIGEDR